ncbi:hypothetical protein [Streptomyces sp. NPDC050504]|uniref:hypothetical protein n=1 Tax=Streptomyces sp. NPDC050504 TaxID=3365618 RepID=UPI0037AB0E27
MFPRRLAFTCLTAMTMTALLTVPAQADALPQTVAATGSPSGVTAICPEGLRPDNDWTITNGDGSPLDPNHRRRWTLSEDGRAISVWIAPYLNSPPPPSSITLTVHCVC